MSVPKITLQSTSRMSLNDRFTGLRGTFDSPDGGGLQQRRQLVQASRKNQRLALQMEQRPTVIAALRGTRGRGRISVRGGVLRGARGARGMIRVGGEVISQRGGAARGYRGGATRGTASSLRVGEVTSQRGGAARGYRGGATRGTASSLRGTATSFRGATARGSIRGINFRTGAPLRVGRATTRQSTVNGSAATVPVKKRLAVQGRLSQPGDVTAATGSQQGWVRGGFNKAASNGFARGDLRSRVTRGPGRGATQTIRGAAYPARGGFQTRTFRGRGRGFRGNRGGYSGGYSNQWENGN